MSQGEIEYLDETAYLSKFGKTEKAKHHNFERIAMQGMTGANDKLRIVMAIVPKGYYLGNSCNYILPPSNVDIKALLALLNSKAINWFFRCFSTNSNVNGYEVDNLPLPDMSISVQRQLSSFVDSIFEKKVTNVLADISVEEAAINRLIYQSYLLTPEQIEVIERT